MFLPRRVAPILLLFIPLTAHAQTQPTSKPKLPFTLSPETTAITAPLTPEGFPDYIAALNQKYSKDVTPENNAFVAYVGIRGTENSVFAPEFHDASLKLLGITPTPANAEIWQTYDEYLAAMLPASQRSAASAEFANLRKRPWKVEDSKLAADYLKKVDKLLNTYVEATKKSHYWSPLVAPSGIILDALIPNLGGLRNMSDALATRATFRAASGDFDGFLSDVTALKRMALLQIHGGPTSIEQLVAVAIDVIASNALGATIANGQLTQAQCARIRDMLAKCEPLPHISIECERWDQLNATQKICAGQFDLAKHADLLGVLKGAVDPFPTIARDQVDWDAVLRKINDEFDTWEDKGKQEPLREFFNPMMDALQMIDGWKTDSLNSDFTLSKRAGESRPAYTERVAHVIISMFTLPYIWKSEVLRRRAVMYNDLLEVLLAAAEIKASTGTWPKDAAAITANSPLKSLPIDMYAVPPAPLLYHLLPNGPQVYSLGDNHKDDNGLHDDTNTKDDLALGADPTANKSP